MSSSRWIVAGLVALNAVLGIAVYQRMHVDQTAQAQVGGRREVLSIAGTANGSAVLYMYDTIGGVMVVMRPDSANKKLEFVAQRDVGADFGRFK